MKIIFVRHGKDNEKYRGGWSKLDLLPEGVIQAEKLANYLEDNKFKYNISQIVSSDLPRTLSTAKIISNKLKLPVIECMQIREINNGDLSGMLNSDALTKYPNLFFNTLSMDEPYPNGETPIEFYSRIKSWFDDFINKYKNHDKNILIVTHSGVINIIYHIVKGIKWTNKSHSFKISNCSMHILDTVLMEFTVENKIDFI